MEFQVNVDKVILSKKTQVESGEYNVTECQFTFSNEYENLTKKAVFTGENGTAYLETIVDNKCFIPSEILQISQNVEIGVYAYELDNTDLVLRYSPKPTQFYIYQGSYKEAQNSTPPTPSEIEQLQAQITTNANDIDTLEGNVSNVKQDIVDIKAEQLVQNQNISNLQTTKADKSEIPTKVSQLTNDSGYIDNTVDDLVNYTKSSDLSTVATSGSYNDLLNKPFIPTKTSEIINDSGYITKNVSDLANYYKKTETYNKTEIDSKISSVYKYKGTVATYDDLPSTSLTVGDVYNVESDGSNYAWTGTTWDKLGGDIDLSEYYTKTQTDSLLSAKANSSDVYNKTETDTLLNNKVDKVQGKGLSTEDFTTAEQTKLAGIEAEANKTIVDSSLDDTSTNPVQNKVIYESQEEQDSQIEALQQENAELQNDIQNMSKAMLTTSGQGTNITLNNTTKNKFVELQCGGNTEQDTDKIIYVCDGTETGTYYFTDNSVNYQFTMPEVSSGDVLVFNTTTLILSLNNVAITTETGTTGTELTFVPAPNPSYEIPVKNVTGNANVKIQNKNLAVSEFNEKLSLSGSGQNRTITLSAYKLSQVIKVKPNTTYTITGNYSSLSDQRIRIFYFDEKPILNSVSTKYIFSDINSAYTFTTDNNTNYILLYGSVTSPQDVIIPNLQLEVGSTATSYVEHKEQNYPFTFAEGQRAMQGTTLQDDGIHNIRKQIILDGTENWQLYGTNVYFTDNTNINGKPIEGNVIGGKCTHTDTTVDTNLKYNSASAHGFFVSNLISYWGLAEASVEAWKQWLSTQYTNKPLIIEYILAEEEIIPYNETQQAQYNAIKKAMSYNEQTNISSTSNELGMIIDAEAIQNINNVINSLIQS